MLSTTKSRNKLLSFFFVSSLKMAFLFVSNQDVVMDTTNRTVHLMDGLTSVEEAAERLYRRVLIVKNIVVIFPTVTRMSAAIPH